MTMQPGEIAREYAAAKNQQKEIGILAELNGCSRDEIRAILREQGVELQRLGRPKRTAPEEAGPETTGTEEAQREKSDLERSMVAQDNRITTLEMMLTELKEASGEEKSEDLTHRDALGTVVRRAAVDTIAELLARTEPECERGFMEQVRGVLCLVHTLEEED